MTLPLHTGMCGYFQRLAVAMAYHFDNLGDYIASAFYQDAVAFTHAQALYLVEIVQRGRLDSNSAAFYRH